MSNKDAVCTAKAAIPEDGARAGVGCRLTGVHQRWPDEQSASVSLRLFSFGVALEVVLHSPKVSAALGEGAFRQAVSLIISHIHTLPHGVPPDPGCFLPPADLSVEACPVTGEENRWRARACARLFSWPVPANRYPSPIRELCLTPGRPCSALVV